MMWSRILAVVVVLAATLWIGSGVFGRTEDPAAEVGQAASAEAEQPLFRVAVDAAKIESHARQIVLSGRTEADSRARAVARTDGSIVELRVHRGDRVNEGDTVAILSDEAREAQVAQAQAFVTQRRTDLEAKLRLIEKGITPANEREQLEADLSAAEAVLAQAQAEYERGQVRAPISGVVSEVPVETGEAVQANDTIAQIVALDPMLAIVEIAERQLAGVKVGDAATVRFVTGASAEGAVRFVSPTASEGTRTYRVDIELDNANGQIPDGITAEVAFRLAPVEAVRIARSALTFSTEGALSVRIVDTENVVRTVAVEIVEDSREEVWVVGVDDGARVIVQGQDFVNDGQHVEAVEAAQSPALISSS